MSICANHILTLKIISPRLSRLLVEMKNASIGPRIESFLAKYLDDKSCPFRIELGNGVLEV